MTKDGNFKRAVRARVRRTGEKYTAARAAMESDGLRQRIRRPVQHEALKAHLEQHYGIHITSVVQFDDDHPATLIVERSDGPTWVARLFTSTADRFERVEADAEILRLLESHRYPAERLAHPEPVTSLDGSGVMVTNFVPGGRVTATPETQRVLGELLGRLHALPPADGAMARDGGSFDHDPAYVGRPAADVAASMNFLRTVEGAVDPKGRAKFDWLLEQVAHADDCEGLPEAFTHANYGTFNAIGAPGDEPVIVGWAASGRAPRLASIGWQLYCTGGNRDQIEALVEGYARHVQLTDEELERLPGAVILRDLYLGCWYYWASVSSGYTPSGGEGWWPDPVYQKAIAAHAVEALSR